MNNTNEAVLREICDMQEKNYGDGVETHVALIDLAKRGRAALAATATVAKDCGEPIDYAGDFVKLAIDEAEKRGLDYVSTRILRALLAKHATLKPEASTEPIILEQDHPEAARWYGMGYLDGTEASAEQPAGECWVCNGAGVEWDDTNKETPCSNNDCAAAPISEDTGKEVRVSGNTGDGVLVIPTAPSGSAAPSDNLMYLFKLIVDEAEASGNSMEPSAWLYGAARKISAALAAPTGESLSARDAALEEAAQIVSEEICSCCWNEEAQAFAEHAADAIRALKTTPGEPT